MIEKYLVKKTDFSGSDYWCLSYYYENYLPLILPRLDPDEIKIISKHKNKRDSNQQILYYASINKMEVGRDSEGIIKITIEIVSYRLNMTVVYYNVKEYQFGHNGRFGNMQDISLSIIVIEDTDKTQYFLYYNYPIIDTETSFIKYERLEIIDFNYVDNPK